MSAVKKILERNKHHETKLIYLNRRFVNELRNEWIFLDNSKKRPKNSSIFQTKDFEVLIKLFSNLQSLFKSFKRIFKQN